MNMTNVLLGITSLLLIVGLALTFGGFAPDRQGDDNKEKLAEMKKQFEKLDAEDRARELANSRAYAYRSNIPPVPAPTPIIASTPIAPAPSIPAPAPAAVPEDLQRIKDLENKVKDLTNENEGLTEAIEAVEEENDDILEEKNERRAEQSMAAKRVEMALTLGTVTTAKKENALVIFTPSTNAGSNLQPGKVLNIRRNSGIVGQIEVQRIAETGECVATMRPHGYSPDGYPDIQPGDTVIINLEG